MIQVSKLGARIMRYELTDHEWAAIKSMLPNKPRGVPRANDRRVLNGTSFGSCDLEHHGVICPTAAARPYLYRARNLVERFFNKIKHCRRVATRYDKLAANYLAFVQLASIPLWLRVNESTIATPKTPTTRGSRLRRLEGPRRRISEPSRLGRPTVKRDHHLWPEGRWHLLDLSFGLRKAECIAQCFNLEHEFHHIASKLCILGFEPLK